MAVLRWIGITTQCIKGVLCINVATSILGRKRDEILIALVGGLVLVLVLSLVLVGNKGERRDKDE